MPFPQPGMMPMQPNLGSSHYPPTFSYAPTTANAQHRGGAYMGSTLASGTVGAAQGIVNTANVGLMGVGAIQGISSLLGAPMLTGGAIGKATGAGVGGVRGFAFGVLGGPVGLGLMGAGAGLSVANTGIQNANRVGNVFGNMQFANAAGDPSTGRGFSQRDLMTLQRGVRAIDANNPFVSMSDALRATERFTEMGMHQGVQDAEKLAKKVTQLGKTMHQMARSLGTSMEEAGQIFQDMRGSGFYSAQDVMGNTANMTLMRGFGMSSQQFAQMQRTGAGMTRGAQMSGRAGAGMITAKTAEFMDAIRTGQMSAEEMMDMTGASSALEAAQMMAQQTLAGTMGGLSGALGTGMLLAAGATDKSGRFTGEIDAGILRRMSQGSLSRNELMDIGGGKRNSRIGQASFMARRQDIMESMLESDQGQEALFGMVRSITEEMFGEGAGEDQDLFQLVAETQFNMDRRAVRKLQELKSGRAQRLAALKREIDTSQRAAEIRENATLSGQVQRLSGSVADLLAPVEDFASAGYRGFVESTQNVERMLIQSATGMGPVVTTGTSQEAVNSSIDRLMAGSLSGGTGFAAVSVDPADFNKISKQEIVDMVLRSEKGDLSPVRSAIEGRVGSGRSPAQLNTMIIEAAKSASAGDRARVSELVRSDTSGASVESMRARNTLSRQREAVKALGPRSFTDRAAYDDLREFANDPLQKDTEAGFLAFGLSLASELPAMFTSELETAHENAMQGGGSAQLIAKYDRFQKDIDSVLARTGDDNLEEAAKHLSEKYGLNLTAGDVRDAKILLENTTGVDAVTRRKGLTKDQKKKIDRAARAMGGLLQDEADARTLKQASAFATKGVTLIENTEVAEKIAQGLAGDLSGKEITDAMRKTIKTLAEEGFQATTGDSLDVQIVGSGVEAFRAIGRAGKDGTVTMGELKGAMGPLPIERLEELVRKAGGSVRDGKITGISTEELQESMGQALALTGGVSTDKQSFLDAGKSREQVLAEAVKRSSESVFKTSEQVEKTALTLERVGITKAANFVGGIVGNPGEREGPG